MRGGIGECQITNSLTYRALYTFFALKVFGCRLSGMYLNELIGY